MKTDRKQKLLICALQILLVGTLMLSGAMRDTWDFGTAAVHILTAGTLLTAFLYCLTSGEFFFPLQMSAAVVFVLFFLFGEMPANLTDYLSVYRLFDALGMAAAGASLAISAAALGAILAHLIRAAHGKIRTGHAACPYLWEMLLCFVWITVIYLFPLSVRFTEWDSILDDEEYMFFFLALTACICTGVYSFVRERFLLPVSLLTVISAGIGFFTYSYPEVYTTAHLFNFAENIQIMGPLWVAPQTALSAGFGALIGRIAVAARDAAAYRREINEYKKSK